MTFRDPYTGVAKTPRPPRPFTQRWWPALVIAAIAAIAGFAEWQNATRPHAPAPASTAATATVNSADSAPSRQAAPASAASGDLAAATVAITKASAQLDRVSELLMGIAALQIVVLAGQLYFLVRHRRDARNGRG
jgi:hypothetical protein